MFDCQIVEEREAIEDFVQQKVCQKQGQDIGTSALVRYQLQFGQDGFNLAFVLILCFIFSIWHRFWAGPAMNPLPSAMQTVVCNLFCQIVTLTKKVIKTRT